MYLISVLSRGNSSTYLYTGESRLNYPIEKFTLYFAKHVYGGYNFVLLQSRYTPNFDEDNDQNYQDKFEQSMNDLGYGSFVITEDMLDD